VPAPLHGMLHDPMLLILLGLFVVVAASWAIGTWLNRRH
jgi:hypothetical protein